MSLSVIILAAGRGSRMKSELPKLLHEIAGKPIINHVLDAAKKISPNEIIITINHNGEDIKNKVNDYNVKWAYQENQLGTGDAVKSALKYVSKNIENILILCGDTPLITSSTLNSFCQNNYDCESQISVMAFLALPPSDYGRLVIKEEKVLRIIETKDANEEELRISVCNSAIMFFKKEILDMFIPLINNNNKQNEYYLTDLIDIASKRNIHTNYFMVDHDEVKGINDKIQLSEVELIYQDKLRKNFMKNGVTLIDPKSVFFSYDTVIHPDVVIYPNVIFGKNVEIKEKVEIRSFSYIEGAVIESGSVVGPFARIRKNTSIGKNSVIGNFVEVKNSNIEENVKISHLSYIGDSKIGNYTNIGAGVITCNFDGFNKYKTNIGNNAFVGSNSILIAPLNIGDGSIIAALSVVNKDVENNSIAISRPELKIFKDKAINFRSRKSSS